MKENSKPWSDIEIISAIQKRDKLLSQYKISGLETDKDGLLLLMQNISSEDTAQEKSSCLKKKPVQNS